MPDKATARSLAEALYTATKAWLAYARPPAGFAPTRSAGAQVADARGAAAARRIAARIASCGLTTDQLHDITAQAVLDNVDDLLTDRDFAPIGDDAARHALRNEADYRLGEAGEAGSIGLARLLYEVLGEPAAITMINRHRRER